jgi:hypothetical protein
MKSLLGTVSNLLSSSEISQLISGLLAILSLVSGLLIESLADIFSHAEAPDLLRTAPVRTYLL